ncbi:hypothetical protein M0638_12125 [Roseomonas sp. NAR14]|uniref:Uncharacterized protein n=1 Tax=Roseomonas acroporae TaxID=2937791 RepID=A0A9X2BXM9_9PROT|nr:hypothetical protein [Roseomonas acroporae]MCK8785130.1 hypothetical protein [Roseomonas acroporae]
MSGAMQGGRPPAGAPAGPGKLAVPFPPLRPRLELDQAAEAIVGDVGDAATALERLLAGNRLVESARLCAHALPRREAVWWACMCARGVPDPALAPADLAALEAAEAWVRRPDEPARRAAMAAAQATGFRSPEAWAAVGAFWSGGSMAPEGAPAVPPAEHFTGAAIAGAVVMASVRVKPERSEQRLARFVASARDIAAGGAGRLPPEAG